MTDLTDKQKQLLMDIAIIPATTYISDKVITVLEKANLKPTDFNLNIFTKEQDAAVLFNNTDNYIWRQLHRSNITFDTSDEDSLYAIYAGISFLIDNKIGLAEIARQDLLKKLQQIETFNTAGGLTAFVAHRNNMWSPSISGSIGKPYLNVQIVEEPYRGLIAENSICNIDMHLLFIFRYKWILHQEKTNASTGWKVI